MGHESRARARPTALDHFLQTSIRVNLHRKQIIKSIDFRSVFTEFLGKGVREIMCWVGRLVFSLSSSRDRNAYLLVIPDADAMHALGHVCRVREIEETRPTMSRTDSRTAASCTAREHEVVVFPAGQSCVPCRMRYMVQDAAQVSWLLLWLTG